MEVRGMGEFSFLLIYGAKLYKELIKAGLSRSLLR